MWVMTRVGALRETPETVRFGPGLRPKRLQPGHPILKKGMALCRNTGLRLFPKENRMLCYPATKHRLESSGKP
jgi:hypothetical protein